MFSISYWLVPSDNNWAFPLAVWVRSPVHVSPGSLHACQQCLCVLAPGGSCTCPAPGGSPRWCPSAPSAGPRTHPAAWTHVHGTLRKGTTRHRGSEAQCNQIPCTMLLKKSPWQKCLPGYLSIQQIIFWIPNQTPFGKFLVDSFQYSSNFHQSWQVSHLKFDK